MLRSFSISQQPGKKINPKALALASIQPSVSSQVRSPLKSINKEQFNATQATKSVRHILTVTFPKIFRFPLQPFLSSSYFPLITFPYRLFIKAFFYLLKAVQGTTVHQRYYLPSYTGSFIYPSSISSSTWSRS